MLEVKRVVGIRVTGPSFWFGVSSPVERTPVYRPCTSPPQTWVRSREGRRKTTGTPTTVSPARDWQGPTAPLSIRRSVLRFPLRTVCPYPRRDPRSITGSSVDLSTTTPLLTPSSLRVGKLNSRRRPFRSLVPRKFDLGLPTQLETTHHLSFCPQVRSPPESVSGPVLSDRHNPQPRADSSRTIPSYPPPFRASRPLGATLTSESSTYVPGTQSSDPYDLSENHHDSRTPVSRTVRT